MLISFESTPHVLYLETSIEYQLMVDPLPVAEPPI